MTCRTSVIERAACSAKPVRAVRAAIRSGAGRTCAPCAEWLTERNLTMTAATGVAAVPCGCVRTGLSSLFTPAAPAPTAIAINIVQANQRMLTPRPRSVSRTAHAQHRSEYSAHPQGGVKPAHSSLEVQGGTPDLELERYRKFCSLISCRSGPTGSMPGVNLSQ